MGRRGRSLRFRSGIARGAAFLGLFAAAACNALVGLDDLEHVLPEGPGSCSNSATDCPAPAGPCEVATCTGEGVCGVQPVPVKEPCAGSAGICNAAGACVECVDDVDCAAPLTCGGGGDPGACGCESPCLEWSKLLGGSNSTDNVFASMMSVHSDSSAFVTGWFDGSIEMGKGAQLVSAGGQDAFIAKIDPGGSVLWGRSVGDPDEQLGFGVGATGDGGVIWTGSFKGTVGFGSEGMTSWTSMGLRDAFVVKLNESGLLAWQNVSSYETATIADQFGARVVLDAAGNSIVFGHFAGGLNFGTPINGADPMDMGAYDVFLVKFGPGGDHLWTKAFGDAKPQRGPGIALDAAGNIYLAGVLSGTLSLSPEPGKCDLTDISGAGEDIWVAKLDPAGNCIWAKNYGNADTQYVQTVDVDADGSVVVAGDLVGAVNFGNGAIASYGDRDAFVLKLDKDGKLAWIRRYGDPKTQGAVAAIFDGSGGVLVAGRFSGEVSFGVGDPLISKSGLDSVFLLKLDSAGNSVWRRGFGETGASESRSVRLDPSGNIFLMGTTTGSIDFGGGLLVSSAAKSMFLAKFKP
ncbi:MAG: hypothetical protein L6Q76_21840 [Polyangiaceae bacterium]|nr:hypothetical protein [Polyangiaceae bacterium]